MQITQYNDNPLSFFVRMAAEKSCKSHNSRMMLRHSGSWFLIRGHEVQQQQDAINLHCLLQVFVSSHLKRCVAHVHTHLCFRVAISLSHLSQQSTNVWKTLEAIPQDLAKQFDNLDHKEEKLEQVGFQTGSTIFPLGASYTLSTCFVWYCIERERERERERDVFSNPEP